MRKMYTYPVCEISAIVMPDSVIAVSGGSWNGSIEGAGTDWGGTDTDESVYGL